MSNGFNEIVLSVLAFRAGQRFSQSANVSGQRFLGGFNVADAIGFERESIEWRSAVSGAMSDISRRAEIITDADGILI